MPVVRVTRADPDMDVGRVINPKTARSQVEGGVITGVGQALFEETHSDPNTGRPVNDDLADYVVCVNSDVSDIEMHYAGGSDFPFNAMDGSASARSASPASRRRSLARPTAGHRVHDLPTKIMKLPGKA